MKSIIIKKKKKKEKEANSKKFRWKKGRNVFLSPERRSGRNGLERFGRSHGGGGGGNP